ncbi:hypothetical protein LJB62_08110 [Bacillus sp. DFI.2.34]|nr:hypothetical protein [Bacillus sp. DFI.2.34]
MSFPPKSGDEKRGSSSKLSGFHQKTVTRISLVVKIKRFSPKKGDEIESRRQKRAFLTEKW